jgi:hypothetical protein
VWPGKINDRWAPSSHSRVEACLISSGIGNDSQGVQRQHNCRRRGFGNKGSCIERSSRCGRRRGDRKKEGR